MSDEIIPTFDDALRLALAFYCIMEPEKRAVVMALADKYTDQSRLMDESVEEAIAAFADGGSEPCEMAISDVHQAERLLQQRDYADHLRDMNFSILEEAIQKLPQ